MNGQSSADTPAWTEIHTEVKRFVAHLPTGLDGFVEARPELPRGQDVPPGCRRSRWLALGPLRKRPEILTEHIFAKITHPTIPYTGVWIGRCTGHVKQPSGSELNAAYCFQFRADFDEKDDRPLPSNEEVLRHFARKGIPPPSSVKDSGTGRHYDWDIDPIPASIARFIHTEFLRLIDHPNSDSSSDQMSRCYRSPGSPNMKSGTLAHLLPDFDFPGRRYDVRELVPGTVLPNEEEMRGLTERERTCIESREQCKRRLRRKIREENPGLSWKQQWELFKHEWPMERRRHVRSSLARDLVVTSAAQDQESTEASEQPREPDGRRSDAGVAQRVAQIRTDGPWPDVDVETLNDVATSVPIPGHGERHCLLPKLLYRGRKAGAMSDEVLLQLHDIWHGLFADRTRTSLEDSRTEFEETFHLPHIHSRRSFLQLLLDSARPHPGLSVIDDLQEVERSKRGKKRNYLLLKVVASLFYTATLVSPEGTPRLAVRTIRDFISLLLGHHTDHPLLSRLESLGCTSPDISRLKVPGTETVCAYIHLLIRHGLVSTVELRPADPVARVASSYTIPTKWQVEAPGSLSTLEGKDLDGWRRRRDAREAPRTTKHQKLMTEVKSRIEELRQGVAVTSVHREAVEARRASLGHRDNPDGSTGQDKHPAPRRPPAGPDERLLDLLRDMLKEDASEEHDGAVSSTGVNG